MSFPTQERHDRQRALCTERFAVALHELSEQLTDAERVPDGQRLETDERQEALLLRRTFERGRIARDRIRSVEHDRVNRSGAGSACGEQRRPGIGVIAAAYVSQIDQQEVDL